MKWQAVDGKLLLDLGKKAVYSSYTLKRKPKMEGSNENMFILPDHVITKDGEKGKRKK